MMPDPLHPAVVHLPIALAILVPGFALLALLAIQRGWLPARSWALIPVLQVLLLGSGWLALETGQQQEERVERVVAERHIDAHEEAAERFLWVAGLGLVISAAGLLPGRRGSLGRAAGTVAAFAVLAAGIYVGHSGGELVYKHGAAASYASPAAPARTTRHPDDD